MKKSHWATWKTIIDGIHVPSTVCCLFIIVWSQFHGIRVVYQCILWHFQITAILLKWQCIFLTRFRVSSCILWVIWWLGVNGNKRTIGITGRICICIVVRGFCNDKHKKQSFMSLHCEHHVLVLENSQSRLKNNNIFFKIPFLENKK